MKLEFHNNKFVLSNLDYEMVQIILNGITCERKKLVEKITYATTCLYKDYSEVQKDEFRNQIDYLKYQNEQLNDIVNECNLILEEMPL
jgi:predicted site-specific integrase-resolvase